MLYVDVVCVLLYHRGLGDLADDCIFGLRTVVTDTL